MPLPAIKLSAPVGPGGRNRPEDVLRMEAFLYQTGDLDLDESGGPTGYAGARLVDALAAYQKRNGLLPDGRADPDGPTVKQMADDAAKRPDDSESAGRNNPADIAKRNKCKRLVADIKNAELNIRDV